MSTSKLEEILKNAIQTSVVTTVATGLTTEENVNELPKFEYMTKQELSMWAQENLDITLKLHQKKSKLIEIIKSELKCLD